MLMIPALIIALILASLSLIPSARESLLLDLTRKNDRVVDKSPGQSFAVELLFRNVGKTIGSWNINVAFEGEKWTWTGTSQNLTLEVGQSRTLTWNGNVLENAPVDSTARLIAYYDDAFQALDSWIHVVSEAHLTIMGSAIE